MSQLADYTPADIPMLSGLPKTVVAFVRLTPNERYRHQLRVCLQNHAPGIT